VDISGNIDLNAFSGKVALSDAVTPFSGPAPAGPHLRDFVGYGAAGASEGSPTPMLSPTLAAVRVLGGEQDTDNNGADIGIATPAPRNSTSPVNPGYPGIVSLESPSYGVMEGAGQVVVGVRLNAPLGHSLSVAYQTTSGTALAGVDYVAASGTLTFAPGSTYQTVAIPIINDTVAGLTKQFTLVLGATTPAAGVGMASATVSILDDDAAAVTEGEAVNLGLAYSGGGWSYSATGLPAGLSLNPATGVVTGTPDYAAAPTGGTAGFTVLVTASGPGGPITSAVPFTVIDSNRLPVLPDQASSEGQDITLRAGWVEAAWDVSYSATGLPAGLVIDRLTGRISGTIAFGAAGPHAVTVTLTDGQGATDTRSFNWLVAASALTANADHYEVVHGQSLSISDALGLLSNDNSGGGSPLTVALVSGPNHGTVTLNADGSFTYAPAAGFWGEDSFVYSVTDGTNTSTAQVGLSVLDAAPRAVHDLFQATHGRALALSAGDGVLGNDFDTDGDFLLAVLVAGPSHGTLTFPTDGSFVYTPAAGFDGYDSFTYRASDGLLSSDVCTVVIEVRDAAPDATGRLYGVHAGMALSAAASYGLLAGASDADGDALAASLVGGPAHGSLTLNGDGSFSYTPDAGFVGLDGFTYRVSDGALNAVASCVLYVHAGNGVPWASGHAATVAHGRPTTLRFADGVLGDGDPEGDPLILSVVSGPAHGTVAVGPEGAFVYTPDAGYVGPDCFEYAVGDGLAWSNAATISLTVQNAAPVAGDDAFAVAHDTPLSVPVASGLLANDSDPEGDPVTAVLVSGPAHGSVELQSDGSFVYMPVSGYAGPDAFVYAATDGVNTTTATVSLTVKPAGSAPVAAGDAYTVACGGYLATGEGEGVLANDADADGDALYATLVTGPSHGTLAFHADGTFEYEPDAGFVGVDSFSYLVSDGTASSAATVTLTATNDAPLAVNDLFSILGSGTTSFDLWRGLLANDTDADGDDLTAILESGPAHGTLHLHPDGSFDYTPEAGFSGQDSFTYRASDGLATSAPATVTLTTAPVALDDAFSLQHDRLFAADAASGVLGNDGVATGAALTAVLVSGPSHGGLTFNPDGSFAYTPAAGFVGEDSFVYRVQAAGVSLNAARVSLSVENQAPTAADDTLDLNCGGATRLLQGDLNWLANDPDPDDALTFAVVAGPAHGTLVLYPDSTDDYQPAAGFVGTDSFTFRVNDGAASSPAATVTIRVADDVPVASDASFDVAEGGVLIVGSGRPLVAMAYDPDGDALTAALIDGPAHGSLTFGSDGTFTYTPDAGFQGDDPFTYCVSDGVFTSGSATVWLHVSGGPVAHDDTYQLPATGPLLVSAAAGLLANDFAPAAGAMTVQLVQGPSSGTLALGADGSFVYTAGPDGPAQGAWFTYRVIVNGVQSAAAALVTLAAPPAASRALKLEPRSLTFRGPVVVTLYEDGTTDSPKAVALSKQWKKGTEASPVALVAGQQYTMTAVFAVNNDDLKAILAAAANNTLKISNGVAGLDPGESGIRPAVRKAFSGEQLVVVTWAGLTARAKAGVIVLSPKWKIDLGDGTGAGAQKEASARQEVYVLAGTPTIDRLSPSVAKLGAKAAEGIALDEPGGADEITRAVMDAFMKKDVKTYKGDPIRYYAAWAKAGNDPKNGKTEALLRLTPVAGVKLCNGTCLAFQSLFLDVLRAQGLTPLDDARLNIKPKAAEGTIWVGGWQATTNAGKAMPLDDVKEIQFKKTNPYFLPANFVSRFYLPITVLSEKRGSLLRPKPAAAAKNVAQNVNDPLSVFQSHALVKLRVGGKFVLFDPSYGSRFETDELDELKAERALLLEWQNSSLDFVSGSPVEDRLRGTVRFDMNRITKTTKELFVGRAPG
jgi:hypothetical protein